MSKLGQQGSRHVDLVVASKARELQEKNASSPTGAGAGEMAAEPTWSGIKTVLATSESHWPGLVIERSVFERNTGGTTGVPPFPLGTGAVVPPPDGHIVVVHSSAPVNLQWRQGRRLRNSLIVPGHVIVNPVGYAEPHAWDKRIEAVRVWIAPNAAHFSCPTPTLRPEIGVHDPLLAQLGRYLARTFEVGLPVDSLYADALAHALGAHLVEHYTDRPTMRHVRSPEALGWRQLQDVYDYIEANLREALTVTQLATVSGVSRTHFTRLFRQQTGEPPHRYVRKRRLDRAERLIVKTQLPLSAIADAVGFADPSHLNRIMRGQRGMTPGQLRKSGGSRC